MARTENVDIHIRARDSASQVMAGFNRNLRNTTSSVGSLRGALSGLTPFLVGGLALGGAAAAMGGITHSMGSAIEAAEEFQDATRRMAEVTTRDLGLVHDEIMGLPLELGDRANLMRGYYQVMSAGITEPVRALDMLSVASMDAQDQEVEQGEVVKALSKYMEGYGGAIGSATEASDNLFRMVRLGQTEFSELVPEIGSAATISRELTVDQYELGGSIAQLTLTAGSTSQAFTQYRGIINSLLKPSERMTELLASMGYASGQALVSELGFVGALEALKTKAEASGHQLGYFVESTEALIGIAALAANEFQGVTQRVEEMGRAGNETANAWDAWRRDMGGIRAEWDATVGKMLIEFGEKLLPVAMQGVQDLTAWVQTHDGEIAAFFDKAATAVGFFAERLGEALGLLGAIAEILSNDLNVVGDQHSGIGAYGGVQLGQIDEAIRNVERARDAVQRRVNLVGPGGQTTYGMAQWLFGDMEKLAEYNSQLEQLYARRDELAEMYHSSAIQRPGAAAGTYMEGWQSIGVRDHGREIGDELGDGIEEATTSGARGAATRYFDIWVDAARERARVQSDFQLEYVRATQGDFAAERLELDRQRDYFAEHVRDQTALRVWYAQESKAIALREAEAQKDAMRDVEAAHEDMTARLGEGIRGFGDTATSVLEALQGNAEVTFSNILQWASQVLDAVSQVAGYSGGSDMISSLVGSLFGGVGKVAGISGGIKAAVMHGGGIAGQPGPSRMVDPGVFAGAQRMHSGGIAGLRADEVPAILQAGEPVLAKGTALGGTTQHNVTINYTVQALDSRDVARGLQENGRVIVGIMEQWYNKRGQNGPMTGRR